jgi:hypothetical protein
MATKNCIFIPKSYLFIKYFIILIANLNFGIRNCCYFLNFKILNIVDLSTNFTVNLRTIRKVYLVFANC